MEVGKDDIKGGVLSGENNKYHSLLCARHCGKHFTCTLPSVFTGTLYMGEMPGLSPFSGTKISLREFKRALLGNLDTDGTDTMERAAQNHLG